MKVSDYQLPANRTAPSSQAITQLSTAAAALRSVLYGRGTVSGATADASLPITLSALTLAFTEVTRTQRVLATGNTTLPEVAAAVTEYQQLLREFKSNLPRFQGWLLAERARLAMRGAHSTLVESWAKTNRQTHKPNSVGRTMP